MRYKKKKYFIWLVIKIIKMPLSLSLSLSLPVTLCSPIHAFAGLNIIGLSRPKPQAPDTRLRRPQRHRPKPTQAPSYQSTSPTHASAHFSSADQTHVDTILPKLQATIASHLSILFVVIEFFFFYFFIFLFFYFF